jgi:hypothetical protein
MSSRARESVSALIVPARERRWCRYNCLSSATICEPRGSLPTRALAENDEANEWLDHATYSWTIGYEVFADLCVGRQKPRTLQHKVAGEHATIARVAARPLGKQACHLHPYRGHASTPLPRSPTPRAPSFLGPPVLAMGHARLAGVLGNLGIGVENATPMRSAACGLSSVGTRQTLPPDRGELAYGRMALRYRRANSTTKAMTT